ncbi:MBL fold metallo-hydrolase [Rubrivirga sp. IMCC43871]|uniref:MBL fold metallo-hydrolase n=1 Tax=Rubrivirga sp. IMCC43871 TaxID=3391575 RepID=UPI00398FAE1F
MTAHLLGTGSANAGPSRTTTMLAIEHDGRTVLVDCGGDAVQRLEVSGLDAAALDAVILTHEHPDHISGFPLLIEKMWLQGRREPIPVYGPAPTLEKARALFAVFNTHKWDGLPERAYHPVEMAPGADVLCLGPLAITATPVDHPVPTIGLRFEAEGAVLAYSCDTAVSDAVVTLASGADVLIHEGTGALAGVHSSPAEAAGVAARAGAGRLVLVHAPHDASDGGLGEARAVFGATAWGHDGDRIDL